MDNTAKRYFKACVGQVGDVVNFNDGEMLIIDKLTATEDDMLYEFNVNELHHWKISAYSSEIASIQHTVSKIDMFDSYFLEATDYLATARRFVHDNALNEAFQNLDGLKLMVEMMIKSIDQIQDDLF